MKGNEGGSYTGRFEAETDVATVSLSKSAILLISGDICSRIKRNSWGLPRLRLPNLQQKLILAIRLNGTEVYFECHLYWIKIFLYSNGK